MSADKPSSRYEIHREVFAQGVLERAFTEFFSKLFRPLRRSDFALVPSRRTSTLELPPMPPLDHSKFGPESARGGILPPKASRSEIADEIRADAHYVDEHPATPDTFYAGILHAERIARMGRDVQDDPQRVRPPIAYIGAESIATRSTHRAPTAYVERRPPAAFVGDHDMGVS